MSSKRIGDPCPGNDGKCNRPLERRADSFYWRGEYKDAAFCVDCNAIWAIADEEIPPLAAGESDDNVQLRQMP
jgi:hypothetical protein